MVGEALCKRLSCIGELSPQDVAAVVQLKGEVRRLERQQDILRSGDVPTFSVIVLKGFLCRHSWKQDGTRQIHSFYMASDAPCLETLHIDCMDNNLGAVTASTVGIVPHHELFRLMEERPNILSLIWRETLIQAAVFREWLMRNSTLPAQSAMAHLFCELFVRAQAAGLCWGNSCDLPATQEVLAQALGLTPVHVNRTLQLLRESGLIDLKNGRLHVHDFEKLSRLGEFESHYLHLRAAGGEEMRRPSLEQC